MRLDRRLPLLLWPSLGVTSAGHRHDQWDHTFGDHGGTLKVSVPDVL